MIFGDADIAAMLADWGHSITIAALTKNCLLDLAGQVLLEQGGVGGQVAIMPVAHVRASDYPAVSNDDAVVVDGVNYTVYQALPVGDGGLTQLALRKV